MAHRRCYLGRGSQNVLSRPGLTDDAISAEAHGTCYLRRVFFSWNFIVVALRAPLLNFYFYRTGVWKSWKILHVILWWWFCQFTIHRRVEAKTSHLSSARKNVPSQLGAWKRPISARRMRTSHLGRFVYRRCEQSLSRIKKLSHNSNFVFNLTGFNKQINFSY